MGGGVHDALRVLVIRTVDQKRELKPKKAYSQQVQPRAQIEDHRP